MRDFSSEFRRRLWFAQHIGAVRTLNGRHYSLPLYHRRPSGMFEPRLSHMDKIELMNWIERTPSV